MSTTGLSTHNTNTGDTGRTTGFGNTFTGTGTGSWADSTTWLILFGGCALVAIGIVAIVRAFTFGKSKRK